MNKNKRGGSAVIHLESSSEEVTGEQGAPQIKQQGKWEGRKDDAAVTVHYCEL